MKKVLYYMPMVFCIVAALVIVSCTKEENNGGEPNGGEPSLMEFGNYTLGCYHPAKHISKLIYEPVFSDKIEYEFVWDGDNLNKIIEDNGQNIHRYIYGDNGYIINIESTNGYHIKHSVEYLKNKVSVFDGSLFICSTVYEFDDSGIVVSFDDWLDESGNIIVSDSVSVIDGNVYECDFSSIYDVYDEYDSHPNPFKNLIFPYSFFRREMVYVMQLEAAPFSKNNRYNRHAGVRVGYEDLDGDGFGDTDNNEAYPVRISIDWGGAITIEYAN